MQLYSLIIEVPPKILEYPKSVPNGKMEQIRIRKLLLQTVKKAVFRIRIHMFLGLPDPDPLVRVMDPDPSILPLSIKNSKKNLIPTVL
jgi:hypothetical protein